MKIINTVAEMQQISDNARRENKKVGVVPTMGFLHEGHLSLVRKAKSECEIVVTTLFVNPTQFGPNEDYEKYPRDLERDSVMAESAGADYLFCPSVLEMYPIGFSTDVKIKNITEKFEGERRPGHFDGVALVVAKLFNAVRPDVAFFGQKDYQQTLVIKRMCQDLNFGIRIIVAPTVRESDGLAMSSRNVYLSSEDRAKATILFNALEEARKAVQDGCRDRKIINAIMHKKLREVSELKLDYAYSACAEDLEEPDFFVPGELVVLIMAVYLGRTRLIDNALVSIPQQRSFK